MPGRFIFSVQGLCSGLSTRTFCPRLTVFVSEPWRRAHLNDNKPPVCTLPTLVKVPSLVPFGRSQPHGAGFGSFPPHVREQPALEMTSRRTDRPKPCMPGYWQSQDSNQMPLAQPQAPLTQHPTFCRVPCSDGVGCALIHARCAYRPSSDLWCSVSESGGWAEVFVDNPAERSARGQSWPCIVRAPHPR